MPDYGPFGQSKLISTSVSLHSSTMVSLLNQNDVHIDVEGLWKKGVFSPIQLKPFLWIVLVEKLQNCGSVAKIIHQLHQFGFELSSMDDHIQKAVVKQEFRSLKSLRKILLYSLLYDSGTGKSD